MTNRWRIAKRYLSGSFVIDFVSIMPYDSLPGRPEFIMPGVINVCHVIDHVVYPILLSQMTLYDVAGMIHVVGMIYFTLHCLPRR